MTMLDAVMGMVVEPKKRKQTIRIRPYFEEGLGMERVLSGSW
jgi:hypothetical protein